MASRPFNEVWCEGTQREMGQRQGQWLRPNLDMLFRTLVNNNMAPRWSRSLNPSVVSGLLALKGVMVYERHISHISQVANAQLERLEGIAEGAAISPYTLFGITSIETMAAHMQFVLGCTSLAVAPELSKTKKAILAYNHDFPSFLKDHIMVRRSFPEGGLASIQLTYPALSGCICGVNEAGIALTLNHAFTTEPFNNGVPPTFLVQQALDHCRSVEEVVDLFASVTFSCGSMVTVLDEFGHMCAMELSRERFGVRHASSGLCLTLNDYQLSYLKEIEVPLNAKFNPRKYPKAFHGYHVHQHNWERRKRFEELMASNRSWGIEDLKRCLSDHRGAKRGSIGTICRHHGTVDTIATAILVPATRTIESCHGHPCRTEFESFSLT